MTTTMKARITKTALGALAALGIALAGLTALPADNAAARPCQMPVEPGEERPVCHLGRAPQSEDLTRSGEEIPTRSTAPLFGGLAGSIEGSGRSIVIPQ